VCDFLHPGWIDPLYKPHFVCFDCRKHFKLRDERVEAYWRGRTGATTTAAPTRDDVGARCPDCSGLLQPVCACFEAPRRTQLRRWKQLRDRYVG
jgi:hypothetical protein